MSASPSAITALPRTCPDDAVWNALVGRQKDFRLLSLKVAPDAFGSTYQREQQFTWDTWENRLRNPHATTLVAIPAVPGTENGTQTHLGSAELLRREWLGQLVLFRMNQEDRAKLSANASPWTALKEGNADATALSHFHLNGMFVTPAARGQGIARRLIEHALACHSSGGSVSPRYTVIVWARNESARRAFEGCGFKVIGEEMHQSGSPEQPRQELALMLEYAPPA